MVGSIAVVVSVLYLAVQLRSSTRVARVAAMDAAAAALRDVTKPFMENAELARIWRTGLENLETLSPDEQARFFHAPSIFESARDDSLPLRLRPARSAALGRLARPLAPLHCRARGFDFI